MGDFTFEVPTAAEREAALEHIEAMSDDIESFAFVEQAAVQFDDRWTTSYAFDVRRGQLGLTLLTGRPPRTADEVVLGPALLARLDRHIGDQVEATVDDRRLPFRVVGTALGPSIDITDFDEEAWLTPDGLARVRLSESWTFAYASLAPGTGTGAATRSELVAGLEWSEPFKPPAVDNLTALGPLPYLLAAFFCLLGLAAVGHAVFLTGRHRDRDLAVLRALGFTRGQAAGTLMTMAATFTLAGLAMGAPLGFALGARAWTAAANAIYVTTELAPVEPLAIATPAAAVALLATATLPARRAARRRIADALRTE